MEAKKSEELLKEFRQAIPLLNQMMEMTEFESAVANVASKEANASEVHAVAERLKRMADLLLGRVMVLKHEVRTEIARIQNVSLQTTQMIDNINIVLLDVARLNAVIQQKQDYINLLDEKIKTKKQENPFDESVRKLERIASVTRQFSPASPMI